MQRVIGLMIRAVVVLVAVAAAGCYQFVDVNLKVVDAETADAVPGATVDVWYGQWPKGPVIPPSSWHAVTDAEGVAPLRVSMKDRVALPSFYVRAPGYLDYEYGTQLKSVYVEVRQILAGDEPARVVRGVVRIWKGPGPVIEIVVPDGFRGYVRLGPPFKVPLMPNEEHQRQFVATLDERGVGRKPTALVLEDKDHELPPVRYEFRYADGTPIPYREHGSARTPKDSTRAWLFAMCTMTDEVFLIASETKAMSERELRGRMHLPETAEFRDRVLRGRLTEGE